MVELTIDHVLFAADGAELGRLADLVKYTLERLDLRAAVAGACDGDQYLVTDVTRPRFHRAETGPVEVYLRSESVPPQLMLLGLQIVQRENPVQASLVRGHDEDHERAH
ncbi:hypothetical protein [Nonomuraea sp. NPDC050405]